MKSEKPYFGDRDLRYYVIIPKQCECCLRVFSVMGNIIDDHFNNLDTVVFGVHGTLIATTNIETVLVLCNERFRYREISREQFDAE